MNKPLVMIERVFRGDRYTIGHLYIDDQYFCDTLKDRVRPASEKIKGQTAIPTGEYTVVKSYSPRFEKILPEILGVNGFSGVRIHTGNTAEDTEGCILVGLNKVKGKVINSRHAFDFLMDRLPDKFILKII